MNNCKTKLLVPRDQIKDADKLELIARAIQSAAQGLAQANDGNETITIRIKDLRDVIHDAIGDVKRYVVEYGWHANSPRWFKDGDGDWCQSEDMTMLESNLVTSILEHRVEE